MSNNRILNHIQACINVKERLLEPAFVELLSSIIKLITNAYQNGNKVIFAGNGGSAADAQHLAAEFVSRFEFDRPGLPAMSLATDTSMITAIGNDYGYEKLFLRQLQAQAKPGDVFVGLTTSGRSPNVLAAFEECSKLGVVSIALCGLGGNLEDKVDHLIRIPSDHTPRIQECHILVGHIICAEVELSIYGEFSPKKL